MEYKDLLELSKAAIKADRKAPVAFSYEVNGDTKNFSSAELNGLLRDEMKSLCCNDRGNFSLHHYKENQNILFELITETINEVLPQRVMKQYAQFAEVKNIEQGERAIFRIRVTEAAKRRARTFVTKVGLAGRYETFMLDGDELEVKTEGVGAGARIGLEEFLDGRFDFADFTEIVLDGIDEFIYVEIAKALAAMVDGLPVANKATVAGFDETTMDELLAIADSFGSRAAIYCTQEFASKMIPSDARMSNGMKDALWEKGWLGDYKGHQVIILEQTLLWGTEEINSTKAIDPSLAYIIPMGSEKPVRVVLEGEPQIRDVEGNDDWSHDVQIYVKVGIGTVASLGGATWVCSYQNSELTTATRH